MTVITSNPLPQSKIPAYLIAEQLDDYIFYYKGYKEVMRGEKTLEDIMGSSVLQFMILRVFFIDCQLLITNLGKFSMNPKMFNHSVVVGREYTHHFPCIFIQGYSG